MQLIIVFRHGRYCDTHYLGEPGPYTKRGRPHQGGIRRVRHVIVLLLLARECLLSLVDNWSQ